MVKTKYDLGTLAAKISDEKIFENQDIVKVITKESLDESKFPKALNFVRKLDKENNQAYHHLGIYCYNVVASPNLQYNHCILKSLPSPVHRNFTIPSNLLSKMSVYKRH